MESRKIAIIGTLEGEKLKDLISIMDEMRQHGHEVAHIEDTSKAEFYKDNDFEVFDLADIDKPKEPKYLDMSASVSDRAMRIINYHAKLPVAMIGSRNPGRILGYYNPDTDKPQGRNESCKCGSGLKFKKCHGLRDTTKWKD
ncbi:SEC-C metal-binding domain-containing protein [Sphingobacterium sp. 1.A.4]|uniref:SEC-C metal-binding domain-containing protein n=1 Tax=Sphingobacterium sp. 1.A.4 TaxID=2044603 RepID=UPI000C0C066D|nr:SEC-C metal-binding domain-containing protein [Sphingobacterium sp. 1.A.4]